ncbi:MAG: RNA polymerase sigma factor [Gemmataceae bacterium]
MEDPQAIRDCLAGNIDAFGIVVRRYQAEALAHAQGLVGNREDARDVVQEAFLDAYRGLKGFAGERFYPWFYTILRHRCLKLIDRRRRQRAISIDVCDPGVQCVPDDGAGSQVREALAALEPDDRELLTLRHLDGLKYQELAERLSVPLGTVMSRLFRARQRLRNRLDHEQPVKTVNE